MDLMGALRNRQEPHSGHASVGNEGRAQDRDAQLATRATSATSRLQNGHRVAVAMFARGGTDRPRTIARPLAPSTTASPSLFTWPSFGTMVPSSGGQSKAERAAPHHRSRKDRPIAGSRAGRALPEAHRLADEADRTQPSGRRCPPAPSACVTVLLDEKGRRSPRRSLPKKLEQWRDRGTREARFIIGAADGHSAEERAAADLLHLLRPSDLAAPARARHARRATLPGHINPCEPPLSSRRLKSARRCPPHPCLSAACASCGERPRSNAQGEPLDVTAARRAGRGAKRRSAARRSFRRLPTQRRTRPKVSQRSEPPPAQAI